MKCSEMRIKFQGKAFDMRTWDEVDFLPREEGFQITLKKVETRPGKFVDEERSHVTNIYFDSTGSEVVRTEYTAEWTTSKVDRSILGGKSLKVVSEY